MKMRYMIHDDWQRGSAKIVNPMAKHVDSVQKDVKWKQTMHSLKCEKYGFHFAIRIKDCFHMQIVSRIRWHCGNGRVSY